MNDMLRNLFDDIHTGLLREGPGNNDSTRRAFGLLHDLPAHPKILDVGCGPGMQTLELAKLTDGEITGLDVRQDFLNRLRSNAANTAAKVKTHQGSMFDMPFAPMSFDLIWSEGAIYIMGFENGLRAWRPFLKNCGFMAASHISWLAPNIAEKPRLFWEAAYPAITHIENNLATIELCGYRNIGHFTLPDAAWWDDYYVPLEKRLHHFKVKYRDDPAAIAVINEELQEIDLFRTYADQYGYVFYIMQKGS
jgi:SAM-dependent methyltransferase